MSDERVQLQVLNAFEPLPVSPSDDQALGYQLLRQTVQSVFPEVDIVVPGSDFIGPGRGQACFLSLCRPAPTQLCLLQTAGGFSWPGWDCAFLESEVKEQEPSGSWADPRPASRPWVGPPAVPPGWTLPSSVQPALAHPRLSPSSQQHFMPCTVRARLTVAV